MIRVTTETETIRCISKDWGDIQKPPYRGVVTITYLSSTVARASAAHGRFTAGDVKRIYAHLADRGIETLLADRGSRHSMPKGKLVATGPLAGLFAVQLTG